MHIAAFIATIGTFLGVMGPWISLGNLGARSGVHFLEGRLILGVVGVMAAASLYAITRKFSRKPIPWQAVVVYGIGGIVVGVYALFLRGTITGEVAQIASRFRVSPSSLLAWGIKSLPFTSFGVTLSAFMAFWMPGEVGGVDESQERRRLG